jgi:hypothetical protein
MERSSIDVIEDVLGARLFPPGWAARSLAEIDESDPNYRAPAISESKYREIQQRLQDHWDAAWKYPDSNKDFLLVCPRVLTPLHQYLTLIGVDAVKEPERAQLGWRIIVQPQIKLDDAVTARKALLFSKGVTVRDPAELLVSGRDTESWKPRWESVFCYLGVLAKLVRADCVRLHPVGRLLHAVAADRTLEQARIEREQTEELRALYRSPRWTDILAELPFADRDEAGIHAGWALGQFAWRNVVAPDATPWLPTKECLTALSALGNVIDRREVGPETITMARFSSKIGVNVSEITDDDLVAIRRNEALFATWRSLVAELCLEVDRLAIDEQADVLTLVQAKEALWLAELERRIGEGGFLSGLFDPGAIACGLITGGVAVAGGMTPELSVASALGGGLINPLIRLVGNLAGRAGKGAMRRAVAAHFMALEG